MRPQTSIRSTSSSVTSSARQSCHQVPFRQRIVVAISIAVVRTFTTDFCETKNGGIRSTGSLSRHPKVSVGFAAILAQMSQMALGDTTVGSRPNSGGRRFERCYRAKAHQGQRGSFDAGAGESSPQDRPWRVHLRWTVCRYPPSHGVFPVKLILLRRPLACHPQSGAERSGAGSEATLTRQRPDTLSRTSAPLRAFCCLCGLCRTPSFWHCASPFAFGSEA